MNDASRLAELVETWRQAIADFVALARDLPEEQWHLPTDLAGWTVKDNVAHTAHLEAVLAGAPEETVEVPEAAHVTDLGALHRAGRLARRDRDVASSPTRSRPPRRYAELRPTRPPTGGAAEDSGRRALDPRALLSNRPFDVWMHEQDIRRAIGRPGGYDTAPRGT